MTIQQIDNLRHRKRMHVSTLCGQAGLSTSAYYKALSGGMRLTKERLDRLAEAVRGFEG